MGRLADCLHELRQMLVVLEVRVDVLETRPVPNLPVLGTSGASGPAATARPFKRCPARSARCPVARSDDNADSDAARRVAADRPGSHYEHRQGMRWEGD